jgi:hypothetical protein
MGRRPIALLLVAAAMLLTESALAGGVPVIVSVAGVRYAGSGKVQLDGRYLDGEARKGDRVFYFDASLRDGTWTIHVSTSPKPGGYPSCWVEGTAKEADGKIEAALTPDWTCAGGGAAAIEIDLPPSP